MEYRLGPRRNSERSPWEGGIPRLAEDLRRCVVFLGRLKAGPVDEAPIDPLGTGFFIHGGEGLGPGIFLATAKHVADGLKPPFVIRINAADGGAKLIYIEHDKDIDWCTHPTESTADIAIAPVDLPSWVDASSYGSDGILTTNAVELADLGTGDWAHVIGLFYMHHGEKKNQPLVHTGHIALLPTDELIQTNNGPVQGYLVQAPTLGGCSGSPVFSSRTIGFGVGDNSIIGASKNVVLLGVWSSSWKVKESEIVAISGDDEADRKGKLAPLGIGVVIPASKLGDILRGEKMVKARAKLAKRKANERSATGDSLELETEPADANPRHKEDFRALLGAAAKKPKSGG